MDQRLLIPIFLILGLMGGTTPTTAMTVSDFTITPRSGAAGTVVQLTGTELYDPNPLAVWLVLALDTAGPGGAIIEAQPLMKLGMTHPDPVGGHAQAAVVIPARLPDGRLITQQQLGIRLTDANDHPLPELGVKAFTFLPAALPATGAAVSLPWLLLLGGASFLIWGMWARFRKTNAR